MTTPILALLLLQTALGNPFGPKRGLNCDDPSQKPMENPCLFEGDIVGFPVNQNAYNAVSNKWILWDNASFPYLIEGPYTEKQLGMISQAMAHISSSTCVTFVERDLQINYVVIAKDMGCNSKVGKSGGRQRLSLANSCFDNVGTIIHELMHALGFYHTHSRSDRDEYVNILQDNIEEGMEEQFKLLPPQQNQLLTEFDYDSILMYGPKTFSKNGKATITSKNPRVSLKSPTRKTQLSEKDVQAINKLYKCQ